MPNREKGKMTGNARPERDKRRDAVNAVRLMCLDQGSAAAASKTFRLYPCDLVAARKVLEDWPQHRQHDTTESQRVEYLLAAGWRKRARPTLR